MSLIIMLLLFPAIVYLCDLFRRLVIAIERIANRLDQLDRLEQQ